MLKKLLATTSLLIMAAAAAQGGALIAQTVGVGSDARPVVDVGGTILPQNGTYVAGGTFATLSDDAIRAAGASFDFAPLIADFQQFGDSGTNANFAGVIQFSASQTVAAGDAFDGKNAYIVVGNGGAGADGGTNSNQWLVYKSPETFDAAKEPTLSVSADLLGATNADLLVGQLGPMIPASQVSDAFAAFDPLQSLQLAGVPEPSTALLLLSGIGSMVFFRRRR